MDERDRLAIEFEKRIYKAAVNALFTKDPCLVTTSHVAGPRACVLFVQSARNTGTILRALRRDEFALVRGMCPFRIPERETIDVYMSGASIRIEIGWPNYLATWQVRLADINDKPYGRGQWVVGVDEYGKTTVCQLSDKTPHFLIAGQTGSGKSVAIQNMIYQLAQDNLNEIVLIDGKWGESLGELAKYSIAPCAVTIDEAKAALVYVTTRMESRYTGDEDYFSDEKQDNERLIVFFDEFQEFTDDKVIAELMRKITSLGRAVKVHLVASTQHPTCEVLADHQTRRNIPGRIALQVEDRTASKVIIGDTSPRADLLTGSGDCYVVAGSIRRRVQGAYVDDADWQNRKWYGHRKVEQWDSVDVILDTKSNFRQYTAEEIANALQSRMHGEGRPTFRARFTDNVPGGDRSRALLSLADDILSRIDIETWRRD